MATDTDAAASATSPAPTSANNEAPKDSSAPPPRMTPMPDTGEVELLCSQCNNLVPLRIAPPTPLPGDRIYRFFCVTCYPDQKSTVSDRYVRKVLNDSGEPTGDEIFLHLLPRSWADATHVAAYNMHILSGRQQTSFHWKNDLTEFIDLHWDRLCPERERVPSWRNSILASLNNHRCAAFSSRPPASDRKNNGYWSLLFTDAPYLFNKATIKKADDEAQPASDCTQGSASPDRDDKKKKKRKRQAELVGMPANKKAAKAQKQKVTPTPTPLFTRPFYQPVKAYEKMRFVLENSAAHVDIDKEDGLGVSNNAGYRTARTWLGVSSGEWYYEVRIEEPYPAHKHPKAESHVRVGWATEKADVNAPAGFDVFGFSLRDSPAFVFHRAIGRQYGSDFHVGDVVGLYIKLTEERFEAVLPEIKLVGGQTPTGRSSAESTNDVKKKVQPETKITRLRHSEIRYFINGEPKGVAFSDIPEGTYYAAVSSYYGGRVRANFGPDFAFPLDAKAFPNCKPLAQVVASFKSVEPADATTSGSAAATPAAATTTTTTTTTDASSPSASDANANAQDGTAAASSAAESANGSNDAAADAAAATSSHPATEPEPSAAPVATTATGSDAMDTESSNAPAPEPEPTSTDSPTAATAAASATAATTTDDPMATEL